MAIDEATQGLLAQLAEMAPQQLHEMTPAQAREFTASLNEQTAPGPEMHGVRDTRVHVSGGTVPVRILTPTDHPRGVVVWFHGGGWVIGGIDEAETVGWTMAARTDCVVVLVGYRKAPEFRYPTAVDDAWAALQWTFSHLDDLVGGLAPVIVGGDSAGGNLAAVVAQRAARRGGPSPSLQVLVYPVTDCDLATTSYQDPENQLLLSRDSMVWFWDHYAPEPATRLHPDASPIRGDFLKLPPAVILTAEHDVLRDEGELYATRLLKARVPVRHRRFPGQMHGFFTMIGALPGADAGMDYVVGAIDAQLTGATADAG
ncbi:alpha/beta hydrolase [Pseudonocardia endophytica]|uniref:Acetyl esterase n=1 Tax=Pseudonocardia endophytica TaxID=401976 RepID=A0A4R1HN46_PSEEN|nr:alpha/beta hydrolase [Pseudonocardia endophytica]TCK22005.1 acetyl esterase [Pseudonocardia endophytica]